MPLSEKDLNHAADRVCSNGYTGDNKTEYNGKPNYTRLLGWERYLIAGVSEFPLFYANSSIIISTIVICDLCHLLKVISKLVNHLDGIFIGKPSITCQVSAILPF